MFWTNWVRGISKVLLTIMILASVIGGGIMMFSGDDDLLIVGIIIMIGGVLFSITSVALVMMISEISINIYRMQNNGVVANDNRSSSVSSSANTYNASVGVFGSNSNSQKRNPHDSWVCKCGKRNPNDAQFCASCKRRKNSVV